MILLDTNVLSETFRSTPNARVAAWLNRQPRSALFISTVTRAELLYGVRILPEGRRREMLLDAVQTVVQEGFTGRLLSFDSDASDAYAEIASGRRAAGRPISQFDAMIAGIARSRGATLATRNTKDFEGCGVSLTNPWSP